MRTAFALCAAALLRAYAAHAQAPFSLDTTFRATFPTWYVASALPLPDGKVLVAGQVHPPDEPFPLIHAGLCRLNADGSWDESFPESSIGRGKITPWVDRFYVSSSQTVRRVHYNGAQDFSFIEMNLGLYFTSLQGGDYHVFPDGRVVMSGMHMLNDPVRGFVGDYNFIWFSNQGYLDTTRTHRSGNGALYDFIELPDGKFIADYNGTVYDGRPTSGIQRMHPDGSLDTTFWAGAGYANIGEFLPTTNGRVYVGGSMVISGEPDTLNLVRMLPNGSLDPSFNNHHDLGLSALSGIDGVVSGIYPFDGDKLIIVGAFESIDGQPYKSIAVIDTTGTLLPIGAGTGCGNYTYQGFTYGGFDALVPCGVDSFYIYGAYHGYNDGAVNDPAQRFISRLVGPYLEVGIPAEDARNAQHWSLQPNPAQDLVTITCPTCEGLAQIVIQDAIGRDVHRATVNGERFDLQIPALSHGAYTVALMHQGQALGVKRLLIQP